MKNCQASIEKVMIIKYLKKNKQRGTNNEANGEKLPNK